MMIGNGIWAAPPRFMLAISPFIQRKNRFMNSLVKLEILSASLWDWTGIKRLLAGFVLSSKQTLDATMMTFLFIHYSYSSFSIIS